MSAGAETDIPQPRPGAVPALRDVRHPAQDHYAAVRAMQAAFDPSALLFSHEYYDVLGLENPRHPEEQEHTGGCAMADVQDFFFNREE